MVIGAQVIKRRIEEPRLLDSQKHRIRSLCRPQPTRAQSLIRLAWFFFFIRQPDFQPAPSTSLKHTQDVARLRDLPAWDRLNKLQDAFHPPLFIRQIPSLLAQRLRLSTLTVTLPK